MLILGELLGSKMVKKNELWWVPLVFATQIDPFK